MQFPTEGANLASESGQSTLHCLANKTKMRFRFGSQIFNPYAVSNDTSSACPSLTSLPSPLPVSLAALLAASTNT